MSKDQFWCAECGTHRDIIEAVTEIKGGTALCAYCNRSLEQELGKGSGEIKKVKTYRLSE
tara:strand:+ start:1221 stop:1400 length:180 start_codon:yes stop_codon:yes gene_type:complete